MLDGVTVRRLVAMNNLESHNGDSGGPWFYSNTAYGIHHGWTSIWFQNRDLFSQLTFIDEALGVTVAQ